jgi:hypothetical protein
MSDRADIHDFHLSGPGFKSRSHKRGVHGDEELRAEAEEGELPVRLRPALRDHARQLQGLLSCDHRGAGAGPVGMLGLRQAARQARARIGIGLGF